MRNKVFKRFESVLLCACGRESPSAPFNSAQMCHKRIVRANDRKQGDQKRTGAKHNPIPLNHLIWFLATYYTKLGAGREMFFGSNRRELVLTFGNVPRHFDFDHTFGDFYFYLKNIMQWLSVLQQQKSYAERRKASAKTFI